MGLFKNVGKTLGNVAEGVADTAADVVSGGIEAAEQGVKALGDAAQGNWAEAGKHVGKGALEIAGQATGPAGEFVTERLEDLLFGGKGGASTSAPKPRDGGAAASPGESRRAERLADEIQGRNAASEYGRAVDEMRGRSRRQSLLAEIEASLSEILSRLEGCSVEEAERMTSPGCSETAAPARRTDASVESQTFQEILAESAPAAGEYLTSEEVTDLELMELSRQHPTKFAEAFEAMSRGEQLEVQHSLESASRMLSTVGEMAGASHESTATMMRSVRA